MFGILRFNVLIIILILLVSVYSMDLQKAAKEIEEKLKGSPNMTSNTVLDVVQQKFEQYGVFDWIIDHWFPNITENDWSRGLRKKRDAEDVVDVDEEITVKKVEHTFKEQFYNMLWYAWYGKPAYD